VDVAHTPSHRNHARSRITVSPLILNGSTRLRRASRWWLVRRNRIEDAEHALRRLTSATFTEEDNRRTVQMMVHTNEMEKQVSEGTSYWGESLHPLPPLPSTFPANSTIPDCFKGTDLRRTEIASVVWMIQTLCGSGIMGASTQFYEQAGLAEVYAFDMNMAQYSIGAIGTVSSWFLMKWFGRRTLYLWGLYGMLAILLIVGFLAIPKHNTGASWATGTMLL